MKITELNLHVTDKMNGKMKGFSSFSVASDRFCQKMSKNKKSICYKCYYQKRMKGCYPDLDNVLKDNFKKLNKTNKKLDWPILNVSWFRLGAFTDIQNEKIMNHYLDFIEKNSHVTFALWTKNIKIVSKVIRKRGKPSNLILVRSSTILNKADQLPEYFDKVFTVWDKESVKKGKVRINCGSKSCLDCRLCYTKNKTVFINEVLK